MSIDLVTAESTFSTSMMQPEALEILAASWARALANNTGFLAYGPALLGNLRGPDGIAGYAFITTGAYVITAFAGGGAQTVTFDGTTVVDATTGEGSINWTGTTDWYPITTDAAAGEYASLYYRPA